MRCSLAAAARRGTHRANQPAEASRCEDSTLASLQADGSIPEEPEAHAAQRFGWKLVDTTLREGEQSAKACFRSDDKVEIAYALDAFGVEYVEVTSPAASPASRRDAERIAGLGLGARVVTHARCRVEDVRAAIDAGVRGVGLFFATSRILRESSHGKSANEILDWMAPPVSFALSAGLEVRFSVEDAFRSEPATVLGVLRAAERLGVHRVGVADTVGIATPRQVRALVRKLRRALSCDIGFHGHDDTGCAIANAYEAIAAGATHVDVSVLGLGERVGITPLGGLIARMLALDPGVGRRYELERLRPLEGIVARAARIDIPFDNYVTGEAAYCHKAGLHLKPMLADTRSYEVVPPEPFGVSRRLVLGSRLTGRHAVAQRAQEIGVALGEDDLASVTWRIKEMADDCDLGQEQIDALLRGFAT